MSADDPILRDEELAAVTGGAVDGVIIKRPVVEDFQIVRPRGGVNPPRVPIARLCGGGGACAAIFKIG